MPGPDLPVHGRFGSTTAAIGPTSIISCGGRGGGDVILSSADILRVVRDGGGAARLAAWSAVAPMGVARAFAAAVAPTCGPWAGLLAVSGGQSTGGKVTRSVEFYSQDANAWSPGPPLFTPRQGHVMWVESDGALVVAGGRDAGGAYLVSCERLPAGASPASPKAGGTGATASPATLQWEAAGDLPMARFRAAAVVV